MKTTQIVITTLCLCLSCFAAEQSKFPELPDSPFKLIETLKNAGDRFTVVGLRLDYVKESDLPQLVALLDSKDPCGFIDCADSSIYYPGKSTVGHEAAYLIEGFWKRYYPTDLTSQRYKPDIEAIKRWYQSWSHLKNRDEQHDATNEGQRFRFGAPTVISEKVDEQRTRDSVAVFTGTVVSSGFDKVVKGNDYWM